jgi:tRNA A-37 threonylcarbamoyl transferase component Bud32
MQSLIESILNLLQMRPVFLDVMKQLQAMIETLSTGSGIYTSTSGGSSSSGGSSHKPRLHYGDGSTDAPSSTHTGSTRSDDGSMSSGHQAKQHMGRGSVAPRRDVCFVVCDLARCNESWQANAAGTAKAIARYGKIVRDLSNNGDHSADAELDEQDAAKQRRDKHKTLMMAVSSEGYLFSRSSLHSGGTFMLAFADANKAASFALSLQSEVRARSWPNNVNIHSRVSLHHEAGVSGALSSDATRTGYDPKHFQEACKINVRCRPGGVICSAAFKSRLLTSGSADGGLARSLRWKPRGDDFYVSSQADGTAADVSSDESEEESDADEEAGWEEKWDQGMGLCSSNWCAWIINKDKITMGAKIGEGNFGRVVAGNYYGSPVAVKQLYKSRLDDTAMIKMRKEAAILSNIDHPHVVKLIGLSVGGDGTLMLVMEQVARGDLRRLLSDSSVKLTWQRKLAMLRDAALGLAFLHSQGIIHRDIKSSNLLVEKSLAIKVGDLGFATAKQDNGTQTRCGTPSWTGTRPHHHSTHARTHTSPGANEQAISKRVQRRRSSAGWASTRRRPTCTASA